VLNGLPFLEYNLRSLYPFAERIVVVEGACLAAASVAREDGHSKDGTLEFLRSFKADLDHHGKLVVVTAEDVGSKDGFWPEKTEMSQAYAHQAVGDWLWQVDYDEFYLARDMARVFDLLDDNPDMAGISFPFIHFWGSFDSVAVGPFFEYDMPAVRRVFRWRRGYQYVEHRPPTVVDDKGRDLFALDWVGADVMRRLEVFMYHYSCVLPKQAHQKAGYYAHVDWSDEYAECGRWLRESFTALRDPYHISEVGRRRPEWLEPYRGSHPAQILQLQRDLQAGVVTEEVRDDGDIRELLASSQYRAMTALLNGWVRAKYAAARAARGLRRFLRGRRG